MAGRETLLAVDDLTIGIGSNGHRLVDTVSFTLGRGETLCIVGESGSGKSLTALSLLGLLPRGLAAESGTAVCDGANLLELKPRALRQVRGRRIGMIFQEPMTALNPVWTLGNQIDEVYRIHTRLNAAARRAKSIAAFAEVGLPDPQRMLTRYPHQISGGQRQRVMIAMALALQPDILIADEPTTALDVTTQAGVLSLIRDMQSRRGMGVLFITHDFGVVSDIADRVAVMRHGRIVETGTKDAVLSAPRELYTQALIRAVPTLEPPPPRHVSGASVMTASGVQKAFKVRRPGSWRTQPFRAVAGVDLELRAGETLGIIGESGSGKSTLARVLLGLMRPDAGSIHVEDTDIAKAGRKELRRMRRRLQVVFQDPASALNRRRRIGDIIAQGPINFGVPRREAEADARRLLEMVGLDAECAGRFPHQFSGGQRQRICIARALALKPRILVADEAVSALDVSVQAQVLKLLTGLRETLGLAMIFITHDLRVAAQTCDRLAVMKAGEIVESGLTADIFAAPSHPYTRSLLAAVPGRADPQA